MNRALQESLVSERLIRVYFCSPFGSLQSERQHLSESLYPRLQKLALECGVSFVPVDIRLDHFANGMPSPDLLPVLFDDLVRSRPFFIGIFGAEFDPPFPYLPPDLVARFPRLSELTGASLTDLEVELAVLSRPQSHEESFFYFLHKENQPNRVPSWFDRLKSTQTPIRENIRTAEELAELIFNDLRAAIERLFPETAPLPVQRRRQETQESFARRHALSHLWRQTTFDKLSQHAQLDEGPPLVVVGPTGSGKSGLLAAWALRHRAAFPNEFCHLHFIGSSPEDTQIDYILRRTIADMKMQLGLPEHIPNAPRDLKAEFALWLNLASARARTIIIFDGIDKLQSSATTIDLSWLPIALPTRVRVMLSVSPSSGKPLGIPESWPLLMLDPLNASERRQFIEEYLGPYKAKISQPRLQRLIDAPGAGNPLILRSLLWEMRRKNFAESKDDQFRDLLLRGSVEELTRELMTRAHRDLDLERPELVAETLSLLWAARRGLTDNELQDLLAAPDHPLPHLQLSVIRSRLDGLVFSHNGLMSLFHPSLRQLIELNFLKDPDKCRELHLKLAEYFLRSPVVWRRLEEGPWHLYKAGAYKELGKWLYQPDTFADAWLSNPDDVRLFSAVCLQDAPGLLLESFDELIKHPAQFSPQAVAAAAEFLFERGHVPEAIALFRSLVRLFRQSGANLDLVRSLLRQGEILLGRDDYATAIMLFREAERLSEENHDHKQLYRSWWLQALVQRRQGNFDDALNLLDRLQQVADEQTDPYFSEGILGETAGILYVQSQYAKAEELHGKREQLCRRLGNMVGLAYALLGKAQVLRSRGDLKKAVQFLAEAESVCRKLGFQEGLQSILTDQGIIAHARGELEEALRLFRSSELISRQQSIQVGLQRALGAQASVLRSRGDLDGSYSLFREQELICRKLGDKEGLQIALGGQAVIRRERGQLNEAMRLARESEKLCRELGYREGLLRVLSTQAMILRDRGDLDGAVGMLREGEAIGRELNLKSGLQRILESLGLVLKARGDMDGALALFREMERICREIGSLVGLQVSLGHQAQILYFRGEVETAMSLFQEQERICRELSLKDRLQHSLGGQAVILRSRGHLDQALAMLKDQEQICRDLGLKAGLQISLYNQGIIGLMRGDLNGALQLFKQQEEICRDAGYKEGLQACIGSQAVILRNRGDLDGALRLFREQEAICREAGYKEGLQVSLCGQSAICQARGEFDRAAALLGEGERICRELNHREGLQRILSSKSIILQQKGDQAGAMETLKEAEKIARSLDHKSGLQRILEYQAGILKKKGDLAGAMKLLKEQEHICRKADIKAGIAASLGNQALVLKDQGDPEAALQLLKEQEAICRNLDLKAPLAKSLANQAELLAQKVDKVQDALSLAANALRLAKDHGLKTLEQQIKPLLASVEGMAKPDANVLPALKVRRDQLSQLATKAALLHHQGDLEKALAELQSQEQVCRKLGYRNELAQCLERQADILRETGQAEKAFDLLTQSEEIWRTTGNQSGLAETLISKAVIKILDFNRTGDATDILEEATRLAATHQISTEARELLGHLNEFIKAH